ncbi:MAG TPA: single-stranded DNA-binding protein, partial [Stenotrophomonas sp.]|nr:single-stranded DNA-binding protein [Stenotrophomonas sp.]
QGGGGGYGNQDQGGAYGQRPQRQAPAQQPAAPPMDDFADDDIPF